MNTLTKGHELQKLAQKEIIDCIDTEGYDTSEFDGSFMSTKEKVTFMYNTFISEVGHYEIPRVGFQKALSSWFQGLPSACTIPWENYRILEMAIKWGSLPKDYTDKQADKLLDNYWNFMSMKAMQLFTKHNLK